MRLWTILAGLTGVLILASCAGGSGGGGELQRPAVAVADEVSAIDRDTLQGRWTCVEQNPFEGRPAQTQTVTYGSDGKGRHEALIDMAEQGAGIPGRMRATYSYDYTVEGDRITVANTQSKVEAVDGSAMTGMMASMAQMVVTNLVDSQKPGAVEVMRLTGSELVVRAAEIEDPVVLRCTRA
jgi:hypothetical protein